MNVDVHYFVTYSDGRKRIYHANHVQRGITAVADRGRGPTVVRVIRYDATDGTDQTREFI